VVLKYVGLHLLLSATLSGCVRQWSAEAVISSLGSLTSESTGGSMLHSVPLAARQRLGPALGYLVSPALLPRIAARSQTLSIVFFI
jgi:hypothetical protein